MFKFEVRPNSVQIKEITARATGRKMEIPEQEIWIDLGGPYPVRCVTATPRNQPHGLAPGKYIGGLECVYVGKYDQLHIDLNKAKPVVAAAPKAGAA